MVLVAIRLFEVVNLKRASLDAMKMLLLLTERLPVRVVETVPLQSKSKIAWSLVCLGSP